jgi:hypothetical protein
MTADIKFKRESAGMYVTEDGRASVEYVDNYETECDEPHPVRMRVDRLDRFSDWYRNRLLHMPGAKRRWRNGVEYLSYQCPGNESHFYGRWIAWDRDAGDYVGAADGAGPDGYATAAEAKAAVRAAMTT